MPFMEKQVEFGKWVNVDTKHGGCSIPADVCGENPTPEDVLPYLQEARDVSDILEIETVEGWGARFSAPGYMDCTEWTVFASEEEAQAYLDEQDDDTDEEG